MVTVVVALVVTVVVVTVVVALVVIVVVLAEFALVVELGLFERRRRQGRQVERRCRWRR